MTRTRRYFIIGHDHNPAIFYQPDAERRWVHCEFEAKEFETADSAVEAIVLDLNGKGRVVEIVLPMVEAACAGATA